MAVEWDMEKSGPATRAEAVTPADSSDLTNVARALFVGTGGNLKVEMQGGDVITFTGVIGGTLYPFAVTKVFSGSTTASNITAIR